MCLTSFNPLSSDILYLIELWKTGAYDILNSDEDHKKKSISLSILQKIIIDHQAPTHTTCDIIPYVHDVRTVKVIFLYQYNSILKI